jgi:glycosyltransferase involved in cell wall biosynthesis
VEGLVQTLESLVPEKELLDIIIVDDGSDVPVSQEQLPIKAKKIIRMSQNGGITKALNAGLEYILGQDYAYIARIDTEDVAVNNRFKTQQGYLEAHPEISAVSSWVEFYSSDTSDIIFAEKFDNSRSPVSSVMHIRNVLIHTGVMVRRDVFEDCGVYSEDYEAAEDYELFMRLLHSGKEIYVIEEVLVKIKASMGEGISFEKCRAQLNSTLRIQLKYFSLIKIQSYAGILRTLVLFILPKGLAHVIKQRLKKS